MSKVLSQQLRGTLATALERHLTIEDFADMDLCRCQTCTKSFDLLLYVSLSLKQVLFLNLTNADRIIFATIYLPFPPYDILCILKFI